MQAGKAGCALCRQYLAWLAWAGLVAASGLVRAGSLSESDYFEEIPNVLTASRLDQPLKDAPGAVTVIDRATIRRSGARDVAELLRLVPGYIVSGASGAEPNAAYHMPQDEYGIRNLVLVDGRSIYSSFFLGDTHRGLMTVMPDDIERIEVLRGANSAAYGANAMFGVINIITRHAFDSQGIELGLSAGTARVRDSRLSLGWGDERASYRLSVGGKSDTGYANAFDDRQLRMLDWRADLKPAADDDLMLKAGASESRYGRGLAWKPDNPEHGVQQRDHYLQGRWQRQLSADSQLQLSADFAEETYADFTSIPVVFRGIVVDTAVLDYGAEAQRTNLELQHQTGLGKGLRAVWGLGWKEEQAKSRPLYTTTDRVGYHERRAFGHLEWRPTERWTVNAGLFAGQHSLVGDYLAPRLMVNHHFTPDQTLRFGVNRSVRTNSLLEVLGQVRYYNPNGRELRFAYAGNLDIRPEVLNSLELSYLGHFRPWHLTLDARAYRERVKDWVSLVETPVVKYPRRFDNLAAFSVSGLEYQLVWSPNEGTRLQWQQNFTELDWYDPSRAGDHAPPVRASTLAWFQQLPRAVDLTLMWHERSTMNWDSVARQLPAARRVDLRLARPWRLGASKAELALTVQALNGDQIEGYPDYRFQRRVFVTLKLEH